MAKVIDIRWKIDGADVDLPTEIDTRKIYR